jgi:CNT family concentrative nucleoside transporter
MFSFLQSILGLGVFIAIAWAISEDRHRMPWRTVIAGLLLQVALALLLIKLPASHVIFQRLGDGVAVLQEATQSGTAFVFGYLGGGDLPFDAAVPGSSFILAFQALPLVLVISAIMALLYYWRILPGLVRVFSRLLDRMMGIGGAGGIVAAANVFIDMIEAPLLS